ncbi:MAG TPA: magnesium transporter CorA family protein [Caulobacter sp.]|nr:magnesium transporter CorA family protein [Caulobacter sp.]
MLRVLRCGGGGLQPVEAGPDWVLPEDVAWIDLTRPERDEELIAEKALGVLLPTREEMAEIEVSSRLYQEDGASFMTAFVLVGADGDDPALEPVTFVLARGRLITIRYVEPRAFVAYAAQAERDADFCSGALEAFLGLLDALVDRIADILEKTSADVEVISGEIFRPSQRAPFKLILRRLGRSQSIAAKARSSLVSLARLLSFAALTEAIADSKEHRDRLRSLQRDVQSLTDHSAYLTENVTFLLDSAVGLINTDQNEIMKVFSVWAVILMPPTLIGSVYGMNFTHMPELGWVGGYPMALGLMVLTMIAPIWWFRRKGWL